MRTQGPSLLAKLQSLAHSTYEEVSPRISVQGRRGGFDEGGMGMGMGWDGTPTMRGYHANDDKNDAGVGVFASSSFSQNSPSHVSLHLFSERSTSSRDPFHLPLRLVPSVPD